MIGQDAEAFLQAAFASLAEKAAPLLEAKVRAAGAASLKELPRSVSDRLFREATMEACALYFPDADLDGLRRLLDAVADERFLQAWRTLNALKAKPYGAFDNVRGRDAAIFLAALGLPVRPLHPANLQPLGRWARSAGDAATAFQGRDDVFVGYDVCTAPFYLALTDCVNTLARRVVSDPRLAQLRDLMLRQGGRLPEPHGRPFEHGCVLLPRLLGERINTILLEDASPDAGSIMLIAGWKTDGVRGGAPNKGVFPVPTRLLNSLLTDPMTLHWMTRSTGPVARPMH